jgi:ribosomal protein L28
MINVVVEVVQNYRDCQECGKRLLNGEQVILISRSDDKRNRQFKVCIECGRIVSERIIDSILDTL